MYIPFQVCSTYLTYHIIHGSRVCLLARSSDCFDCFSLQARTAASQLDRWQVVQHRLKSRDFPQYRYGWSSITTDYFLFPLACCRLLTIASGEPCRFCLLCITEILVLSEEPQILPTCLPRQVLSWFGGQDDFWHSWWPFIIRGRRWIGREIVPDDRPFNPRRWGSYIVDSSS